LAGYRGGTAGVSVMLILLAVITFISTLAARETKDDRSLQQTIQLLRQAGQFFEVYAKLRN
jgi:anaerobic C4-dicarboxylate transporter